MAFLKNKSVNLMNLHFGLQQLASSMVGIFVGAYLFEAGFLLWQIFAIWLVMFCLRILARPLALRLIHRIGLRRTLIFGSFNFGVIYLTLSQVTGALDLWLLAYMLIAAINDPLYWLPYHTYFTQLSTDGETGRQVSMREFLRTGVQVVGPILAAFVATQLGFSFNFIVAAGVALATAIPFFWLPDTKREKIQRTKDAWRKTDKRGFFLYLSDGLFFSSFFTVWALMSYFGAGNLMAFGGLFALAALVQMLGGLVIGHFLDARRTRMIVRLTIAAAVGIPIARFFFHENIIEIAIVNAFVAIVMGLIVPVFNTAFYNISRKSESPLYFQYFAETGWDIGAIGYLASASIITFFNVELRFALLPSLASVAIFGYILYRYYEVEHHTLKSNA